MAANLEFERDGETITQACDPIVTIGRDTASSVPILNDPLVSRNHAIIRRLGRGQFYFMDMGSRNGSSVNGRRISTPRLLKNGDVVTVGDTNMTFRQDDEGTADSQIDEETELDLGETISMATSAVEPVTILVADIRGFTKLTEKVPITSLSRIMSDWFQRVQATVEEHDGAVDKFIGDCVMAVWPTEKHARQTILRALRAAVEIGELTTALGKLYPEVPHELRVGAGINTGLAAVGVGAERTAMGDAVNLAFRLETYTKEMQKDVVISHSSYCHLPKTLWCGVEEEIVVRGKSIPTKIRGLTYAEVHGILDNADDAR